MRHVTDKVAPNSLEMMHTGFVTHEQQVFVEVQLISHFRLKVLDPGFDIDSFGRYSLILQTLGKIETAMIRAQDHYHGSSAGLNAIEELPEPLLLGAYIEIEEARLGHKDIRTLYDSAEFPLEKRAMEPALTKVDN